MLPESREQTQGGQEVDYKATAPAFLVICLGATIFLCGIVAIGLLFYQKTKSNKYYTGNGEGGVFLSPRSDHEHYPLTHGHQFVITSKRAAIIPDTKCTHLINKKSPSPPLHYASPKTASPLTPPSAGGDDYNSLNGGVASSPSKLPKMTVTAEIHSGLLSGQSQCIPPPVPKRQTVPPLVSTRYGQSPVNLQQSQQSASSSRNGTPGKLSPNTSPPGSTIDIQSSHQNHQNLTDLKNGNLDKNPPLIPTTLQLIGSTTAIPAAETSITISGPEDPNDSQIIQANHHHQQQVQLSGGGQNALGTLHFKIRYREEKGALVVTVIRAENLPVKDTTLMTADPYVKLQILPDKQQRVKTRVLRHTRQPLFDEDFTFFGIQPNQLEMISLHFVVLSFDRYSRDEVIGEVFCPLTSVDIPETDNHEMEISRDILPRNLKIRSQGRGEVLLSLCWQPTANRLTVVILKARNLPKMDVTGLADPYAKLYLFYDGQRITKKKTHIKKRTLNPVYNESFVFDLPPSASQDGKLLEKVSLQLLLLDWDRVTKNEVIGRLELGTNLNENCSAAHHWSEVLSCPRRQIAEWHKLRD